MLTSEPRGLIAWVEVALGALAVVAHRRPGLALAMVAILTLVSALGAQRLTVNADLRELLPDTFQSVQDLEALKKRFAGVGYVCVVGMGTDEEQLKRFADDIAPKLEALERIRYVDAHRPREFFEKRTLYYLDLEDLQLIESQLVAREKYERLHNNPMYLDLEEQEPPSLDFPDLREKYVTNDADGSVDSSWLLAQMGDKYYLDRDKRMVVVLSKPADSGDELYLAREVITDVLAVVDSIDKSAYGPNFDIGVTGRYMRRVDQQDLLRRDLALTSTVAILAVVICLVAHFRRFAAVLLLMAPLVLGVSWAFGFAGFLFGILNILTAFVGAILLGLGIDHGIHLLGRYEAERGHTDTTTAIRKTFGNTGRAVLVAAITTTVGFAGLGMSEFRAFREFGILAAAGMVFVVLSYTACLPALLSIADRWGWRPRFVKKETSSTYARFILSGPTRVVLLSAVLFAIISYGLTALRFDYDFATLEANHLRSYLLDQDVNRILGYSQSPVVVLTDTMEDERQVAKALRERHKSLGADSTMHFIAASTDLMPLQQEEKKPVIEAIGEIVGEIKPKWLEPDKRRTLKRIRGMISAEPFSKDALPEAVRRQFFGANATGNEGLVLIFPAISLSDGQAVRVLADQVRTVPVSNGREVSAAGESMILADILNMVYRESPPVLAFTLVMVFLTMLVLLGRLGLTLLCLIPAATTLLGTLALLPAIGVDLNYLNIIMIPILFGISVDGGVHLVTRLVRTNEFARVLTETGRNIAVAILTTGLGFGALMLADQRGLGTLGKMAALGLGVNLLSCLVLLPAILAWRRKRAEG